MKKLNKLIMPIATISTVSVAAMPLVACNKTVQYIEVTEADWKAALGYLCGFSQDPVYWKMTNDSYFVYYTQEEGEDVYETFKNWIVNPEGIYMKLVGEGEYFEPVGTVEAEMYEKFVNNFLYQYETTAKPEKLEGYDITTCTNGAYGLLLDLISSCYENYNEFTFKSDNLYHYEGIWETGTTLSTKIGFDKNKRVSHFETKFVNFNDKEAAQAKIDFDYSRQIIEWKEEHNTRIKNHTFDFAAGSTEKEINTTICKQEDEGIIISFTAPEDGIKTLTAYKDSQIADVFPAHPTIIKNGIDISEYTSAGGVITFTDALKQGDTINIKFSPKIYDTYTLKLAK